MRISDWSSDVCSSDLILEEGAAPAAKQESKVEPARNESVATSSASTPAMSSEDGQSPAVRKLLSELGLSASQISGSGKGGRLTVEDVKASADKPKTAAKVDAPKAAEPAAPSALGAREEQRVPRTNTRARRAERHPPPKQTH